MSLSFLSVSGFEKGLADRGRWREETLPMPVVQTSFLQNFPMPFEEKGNTILGTFFAVFWPKTIQKGHLHKVFVRDIPTSGSLMSQEYPGQKLCLLAIFFFFLIYAA